MMDVILELIVHGRRVSQGEIRKKRYRITLTDLECEELSSMVSKGKSNARKLIRARILLLPDEAAEDSAESDPEIVDALGCGRATVEPVRRPFVEEGLEETLGPSPSRRIYDRKMNGRIETQLVALACGSPPEGRSTHRINLKFASGE